MSRKRQNFATGPADFARTIGIPYGTLRQWEQKRRHPTGAARVLLARIDRKPDLVSELLIEGAD